MNLIIGPVLCLLPLVLVLAFIFRKRKEQRALSCAPFKELQRRPAGETLRIELEALEEQLTDDALEGCQGLFSYFDFLFSNLVHCVETRMKPCLAGLKMEYGTEMFVKVPLPVTIKLVCQVPAARFVR